MTSDFLLIQKIKNGDSSAAARLVEKYYASIYQYCFLHIRDRYLAEDMAQETFVRFFEAVVRYEDTGRTRRYLYCIAGNPQFGTRLNSARILLFAAADLVMITIFFAVSFRTLPISGCRIVINFLIPFNVSCCICFRLLYSRWSEMEYIAVLLSMLCVILWTVIATNDFRGEDPSGREEYFQHRSGIPWNIGVSSAGLWVLPGSLCI